MNWKSRVLLACTAAFAAHFVAATAYAQQTPTSQPRLAEIRTASNNILVVYFKSPHLEAIDMDIDKWRLNRQTPLEISRWGTPKWDGVEFEYEHHIYLRFQDAFVQDKQYLLTSPHGKVTFVFDEKQAYCESIKTNQSAYSALSTTRFANFAIWTANGKVERLEGALPRYRVVEIDTGKKIAAGELEEVGPCENAGDFVYRMDLSNVPAGGPYKIVVQGVGCSFPFGVGGAFSDRLAYVSFRGLLHERCGMEQKTPYFDHDIRDACHTRVYVTDSKPREAKVDFSPDDPVINVYGGYHDAGDCDRRDHHMMAPIFLLSMYDAFPKYFTDLQYNIPDKFDAKYVPVGKGNGIPDIIDEAEWGTLIFEYLQEESGGVRSGIERNGYPENGPTVDNDAAKYGTFRVALSRPVSRRGCSPISPDRCSLTIPIGQRSCESERSRLGRLPAIKLGQPTSCITTHSIIFSPATKNPIRDSSKTPRSLKSISKDTKTIRGRSPRARSSSAPISSATSWKQNEKRIPALPGYLRRLSAKRRTSASRIFMQIPIPTGRATRIAGGAARQPKANMPSHVFCSGD